MNERAIRIRKMTDIQICEFIDHIYGRGMEEGVRLSGIQPDGAESARRFIKYLEDRLGSGNRIGRGSIMYLGRELENAVADGVFAES